MLELSHSSISSAKDCWMKYKFRYIDKLAPIIDKPALTLGKAIHTAFDNYYSRFLEDEEEVAVEIKKWFEKEISETTNLGYIEDLTIAMYTALGMWTFYPYKFRDKYEEMKSEESFNIVVDNKFIFRGKVDGLVKMDGNWWIREFKTTGLSENQFETRMKTSTQVTGYIYAMRKLGYDVKGIIFDFIKKPRLRKRVNDTATTFGERIFLDYKDKKYYAPYFPFYTYRTDDILNMFEKDLIAFYGFLEQQYKTNQWYRNPDACWKFNSECPYMKICFKDKLDPLTVKAFYKTGGHYYG